MGSRNHFVPCLFFFFHVLVACVRVKCKDHVSPGNDLTRTLPPSILFSVTAILVYLAPGNLVHVDVCSSQRVSRTADVTPGAYLVRIICISCYTAAVLLRTGILYEVRQ